MKLLKQINKNLTESAASIAEQLVEHIVKGIDVEEMRRNRGRHFTTTQFYQIRVKPSKKDEALDSLLKKLEEHLKSPESAALGITEVQINERSRNSSKYASVSFKSKGKNFDAVVAKGKNAGESFEKNLLLKMDALVAKGAGQLDLQDEEHARAAFDALEKVDPAFKLSNVASVSPRSGTTRRNGDISPEETGAIIADIVVKLKNGEKKYISVKSQRGSTVAQFGLVRAFTDDLKVDTSSDEWKFWLSPFGLDPNKISKGLKAAKNQTEINFKDIETKIVPIKKDSGVYKIIEKMWGTNYYLLRETPRGDFTALKIDKKYVDNVLLKNLKMYEVRYPSKDRKQINVYLQSDYAKYKIEVRNPRGMGYIKPSQIQLTVLKGTSK